MKPENKKKMLELCSYYKGEEKNPFPDQFPDEDFWRIEKQFFSNPNVFQIHNLEGSFKEYVQDYLGKMADWLMVDSPEIIDLYFKN